MIRPTRAWRTAVVLASASLVLTACGSDDSETAGGDAGESASPSESAEESGAAEPQGDGTLRIGSLLPQTGDLAFLGPPEFAGVDAAVADINADMLAVGEERARRRGLEAVRLVQAAYHGRSLALYTKLGRREDVLHFDIALAKDPQVK